MRSTYGTVLTRPGAAAFSLAALVSRLPLSMAGLGIVLLVQERSGSYGAAGTVAAAHVLATAVMGPVQGKLADRLGQPPVLWSAATLYLVAMTLTLVAIDADWPTPWPHACAALAGLATPQTGSMVRARWAHAIDDRSLLNTAFSLEAVLDEVVFVVGPVLVTFLTLHVHPYAGLGVATAAATGGAWALAAQRRTAPPVTRVAGRVAEPVAWTFLAPLVVASIGLGVLFGSTEVLVVAFTSEQGHRSAAGAVLAVWAAGSLLAGLAVGALPRARDLLVRFRTCFLLLGLLFVPLPFLSSVWWLGLGMFLAGSMIAPTLISMASLIELHVPSSRLTEALTWTTTGLAVGIAPGAAGAGWAVDHGGASSGFLVPLAAGLVGAGLAWLVRPPVGMTAR